MSERAVEGQSAAKRIKFDLIGGKVDTVQGPEAENNQYIAARFTRNGELKVKITDVEVTAQNASEGTVGDPADIPLSATQVGAVATAAVPTHTENTLNELSQDLNGDLRTRITDAQGAIASVAPLEALQIGVNATAAAPTHTENTLNELSVDLSGDLRTLITDVQATPDAAAPAQALQVGAVANAAAPTPDEGDIGALSMNLTSELRTRLDLAQAAHDAAVPSQVVLQGQYAETTVPTAVADGDTVRPWFDEYGRQVGFADDQSSGSRLVTVITQPSRNTIGPLTFTQIDEPGETAVTDIEGTPNWCFQIVAAGTPAAATVRAFGSHDNSNFFLLSTDTTAKAGLAIANNVGTISAADTYEWKGFTPCKYIKLEIMGTSGSPDAATFDIQLMASA